MGFEYKPPIIKIYNTNVTINISGLNLNHGSYPNAGLRQRGLSFSGLGYPLNYLARSTSYTITNLGSIPYPYASTSGLSFAGLDAFISPLIKAELIQNKNVTINILNKSEEVKEKVKVKNVNNKVQKNISIGNINFSKLKRGPLLWSDEFDYSGVPNPNEWNQETEEWINDGLQFDSKLNAQVNDGILTIVSKKENMSNKQYTSAILISKRKFKYGIIEYRAKLPKGLGTWPAFWLLAAKRPLQWPNDGEIVIMGHEGREPGVAHNTIHSKKNNQTNGVQKGKKVKVDNIFDEFHTYSVDWNAKRLKFYIDDNETFSYYKEEDANEESWPFDNEMNIIINTVIGGSQGIDDSIFPVNHIVDYVRQYESIDN